MLLLFQETRSWRIATLGFLLTFFHLDRLCLEPGHPQEFCVLAVMACVLIGSRLVRSEQPVRLAVVLGLAVGATAMVKLNIGVFLFVSATLLLLLRGPQNALGKTLLRLGAVGAVALPFLVAHTRVLDGTAVQLPILCAASLACVVLTAQRRELDTPRLTPASWLAFLAGVAGVVTVSCGGALLNGTSLAGLSHGLVTQHIGFEKEFYSRPPVQIVSLIFAGLLLDAVWRGPSRQTVGLIRLAVVATLIFCAFQYLQDVKQPLIHGTVERGGSAWLLGMVAPSIWVLLLPGVGIGGDHEDKRLSLGRLPLCLFASLQPMAAYPTPGTQMAVGTLLLGLGALIALRDAVSCEQQWLPRVELAVPFLILILACTLGVRALYAYRYRQSLTPLAMPGADLLRVPKKQAEDFQWLVETLRAEADTFYFRDYARYSLYFWTEEHPPSSLNAPYWQFQLREQEQQRIVAGLKESPRSAIVYIPYPAHVKLPASPLLDYIAEHYEPVKERQGDEIWLPRRDGK